MKYTSASSDNFPSQVGTIGTNNTETFQPSLEEYPEYSSNSISESGAELPANKAKHH